MKHCCDRCTQGLMPSVGDLVLDRKLGLKRKHKITDKQEKEVYRVIGKEGVPTYIVVPDKES